MSESAPARVVQIGAAMLHHGDCLEVMRSLPAQSVDSVVCDPPYHLTSIVKRFGGANAAPAQQGTDGAYARASRGFMGKTWDGGDIAFRPETWAEVLRVLKPGGHLIAFGGTRTFHRMVCAIEDAGFEVRDQLAYLYGTGFPKSHNLDKTAKDLVCGCSSGPNNLPVLWDTKDDPVGMEKAEQGRILQPLVQSEDCQRPDPYSALVQRKGGLDCREFGVLHGQNVRPGQSSLEGRCDASAAARELRVGALREVPSGTDEYGPQGRVCDGAPVSHGSVGREAVAAGRSGASQGSPAAEQLSEQFGTLAVQPDAQAGGAWPRCARCGKPRIAKGLGTALKPAQEPICLARRPLEGTIAANVLAHGCGALNIDGCRIASGPRPAREPAGRNGNVYGSGLEGSRAVEDTTLGRWPANVLHDGSPEVEAAFAAFGEAGGGFGKRGGQRESAYGFGGTMQTVGFGDTGTASRFFYCAKASAADRAGSSHPTVKPLSLMRYLVTLVTPSRGVVLDPFAGSGTTGAAAVAGGFRPILIEREEEYFEDCVRRLSAVPVLEEPAAPRPVVAPAPAVRKSRAAAKAKPRPPCPQWDMFPEPSL